MHIFVNMDHDKYNNISISSNTLDFKFTSTGTKGELEKLVQFKPFENRDDIYNLALGTIDDRGQVDFETLSKNGDRNKILATIGASAYVFSETYPDRKIFLRGDIPSKTRLYQIAIGTAHEELCQTFSIQGLILNKEDKKYIAEEFKKGKNYDAFLFIRKEQEDEVN